MLSIFLLLLIKHKWPHLSPHSTSTKGYCVLHFNSHGQSNNEKFSVMEKPEFQTIEPFNLYNISIFEIPCRDSEISSLISLVKIFGIIRTINLQWSKYI